MSSTVHAGPAVTMPRRGERVSFAMPEVVLGDALLAAALALGVLALGIAWVLLPVITGPSVFDFVWAALVGLPITVLVAPRLIRRAIRIARVSLSVGPDGVHARGKQGDYHFAWRQVARLRPESAKDRIVVALDLVDGRSLVVSALGVRAKNERAYKRLLEICWQIEQMRPTRERPAPAVELDPALIAPRTRAIRLFTRSVALRLLAGFAALLAASGFFTAVEPHAASGSSRAAGLVVSGVGALIGALARVHIRRRPLAVAGSGLAAAAIGLGTLGLLVGGIVLAVR